MGISVESKEKELLLILSSLIDRISYSQSTEVVLQQTATELQKKLNCDRVIISSNANSHTSFTVQASDINIAPIIPEEYNSFLAEVFTNNKIDYQQYQEGSVQVNNDSNFNNHEKEYLNQAKVQAQLIIPIKIPTDLWGWLIIHQCSSADVLEKLEIKLLQSVANQVAIAIRQELLEEQLQQKNHKLQQLELLDPVTNVYNRRYLDHQLPLEWRRLQRIPSPVSIILCDIDYFESYKDIYGLSAGNQCLQQVAEILLKASKRSADFVSLYSEDIFAITLPHTPLAGAQQIVTTIQQMLEQSQFPHKKSNVSSFVTLSFGIASTIPNRQESPTLLIKAAEQALYRAKGLGRNCSAIYNQEISQLQLEQQQELAWGKRLHHALEKDLFCLYAQSIKPLDTEDQRQHFEILLRLKEQDDVIIAPNDFLPIANRFSMMPQIDSWVIENLFTQLADSKSTNYQKYVFTVNLSGASLNDDVFLEFLQAKIIEYQLDPKLFCFEITESVAIDNMEKISGFIQTLKALGCSFALDDFGTGMSSLSYLKQLPVDYLKIDGSFIREINNDSTTKSMVVAINNLAQIIGLKTIAEFVEDQAILQTIQDLKVDYAQGFYFGKPCLLNNVIS